MEIESIRIIINITHIENYRISRKLPKLKLVTSPCSESEENTIRKTSLNTQVNRRYDKQVYHPPRAGFLPPTGLLQVGPLPINGLYSVNRK